jgi:uncharacterized membrane protein YbjE (DUF340 family)
MAMNGGGVLRKAVLLMFVPRFARRFDPAIVDFGGAPLTYR